MCQMRSLREICARDKTYKSFYLTSEKIRGLLEPKKNNRAFIYMMQEMSVEITEDARQTFKISIFCLTENIMVFFFLSVGRNIL